MVAHGRQGQLGAVGHPVQVPLIVSQGHPQVPHVGGVLNRGVGFRVDSLLHQPVVALAKRTEELHVGILGAEVPVQEVVVGPGVLWAVEGGLG